MWHVLLDARSGEDPGRGRPMRRSASESIKIVVISKRIAQCVLETLRRYHIEAHFPFRVTDGQALRPKTSIWDVCRETSSVTCTAWHV